MAFPSDRRQGLRQGLVVACSQLCGKAFGRDDVADSHLGWPNDDPKKKWSAAASCSGQGFLDKFPATALVGCGGQALGLVDGDASNELDVVALPRWDSDRQKRSCKSFKKSEKQQQMVAFLLLGG